LLKGFTESERKIVLNHHSFLDDTNTDESCSALTYAIVRGLPIESLELLIHEGSNINEKYTIHGVYTKNVDTPFELFIRERALDEYMSEKYLMHVINQLKMFVDNGAVITPKILKLAEEKSNPKIFSYLLENFNEQQTKLMNSWMNLRSMEEVNIFEENDFGDTPLIIAANMGDLNKVNLLVKMGSDVNHKNKKKQTALHNAACNKHLEVVNLLKKNGADSTMVDDMGMTCQDLIRY
jgi:hypothetical protein